MDQVKVIDIGLVLNKDYSMVQNTQQFEFHGKTGEFFKIWIVNIMLSIVTLGIYSAWATVRTRQYFYNNTLLISTPFNYLADPVKILKGRLLALAFILLYSFSSMLSPILQGVLVIAFVPLFPWIIIQALRFNHYNSAYRHIRFHFNAEYSRALWVFVALPILVTLSVGLAYPYFIKTQKQFIIDHSSYGTSSFNMKANTGSFYDIFLRLIGLIILIAVLSILIMASLFELLNTSMSDRMLVFSILFFVLYIYAFGYWYSNLTNLVINNISLQQCQLESQLETSKICWIFLSNTLAIICSLGLLIPWATIRTSRYRISCLSIVINTDSEVFIAATSEQANAIGEEVGDFLDIDLGL